MHGTSVDKAESAVKVDSQVFPEAAGANDTIYLCNFRVSVDGEWLCLKELQDLDMQDSMYSEQVTSPEETGPILDRDPVVVERSNLVNISKLVVKELIEQSLRYGRMLDTDHLPLRHFFIVLEHVLRHGLKPKKGLLGPKKELWDILQMVEKFAPEAQDITASVRDLPTVRTAMGRARAWLRLALMQKKLADYLRVLLDHREQALDDFFEPHALVLSDEAVVIMGLLIGLNVIDCNLCVKEEDLDSQQGVIDFSLYLRNSGNDSENPAPVTAPPGPHRKQIAAVLDQKNYIEELNRHLNATVANLQAKVESLTTTNALMKEDLAIAKNNMLQLYEENMQFKHALGQDIHPRDHRLKNTEAKPSEDEDKDSNKSEKKDDKGVNQDLKKALEDERQKRHEIQKELELQTCMKAEMEVAMKLLEKDIHDKQDTIVSLRRQLDDIKLINLEMYKKLQVCESSLKHKTELITKLEEKTDSMCKTIDQLHENLSTEKELRTKADKEVDKLSDKILHLEKYGLDEEKQRREEIEKELHLETSMKAEMEVAMKLLEKDIYDKQDIIISLSKQLADVKLTNLDMSKKLEVNKSLEEKLLSVQEEFEEAQTALEELGGALSFDKLRLAELTEAVNKKGGENKTPQWTKDQNATNCTACHKEFNLTRRKHHCRKCGDIFCGACSEGSAALPGAQKPVRVCDSCYKSLTNQSQLY